MTENLFDYAERYPEAPGYKDPDTSKEAAESMKPSAGILRAKCLEALRSGPATADEIAERLGLSVLSARPRFSELLREGKIEDTGERRVNASGRRAKTWRAV